jgi:hypothetical protein
MDQRDEAEEQVGLILGHGPNGEIYVVGGPEAEAPATGAKPEDDVAAIIEPAKVMRIGRMISRLLDEVKDAPLDDASRARLREIYTQSIDELAGGLDAELAEELRRITSPFASDNTPSDAELRVAQAQLVGWLEGLFQGLQTALVAQQMAARSQIEQMRKALGGRHSPDGSPVADKPDRAANVGPAGGVYL